MSVDPEFVRLSASVRRRPRWLPRSPEAPVASLIFGLLLLSSRLSVEGQEPTPPKAPSAPTLDEYIDALERFQPQAVEASGLKVRCSVTPDAYLHDLAVELRKGKRSGFTGKKLEKHLEKAHRRLRRQRQQVRVHFWIEPATVKDHAFLRKKLKSHVDVEGEGRVRTVSEGKPKPRFDPWQIIQGASLKKFTLARFEKLEFDVMIQKKSKELCSVRLVGLMHYFEAQKRSRYETKGINVSARQISLGTIRDMQVDPIAFELAPATWELPPLPNELVPWVKKFLQD